MGSRDSICSKATGPVLEVAIGTGLNLAHYPASVQLTGVEWSPAMLQISRERSRQLDVEVDLRQGDAQALAFPDAAFDTVVCTFSLCAIPDDQKAVAEISRVLRPGRLLLLADHVEASPWYARAVQALIEPVSRQAASICGAARSGTCRHWGSRSRTTTGSSWASSNGWPPASHDRPSIVADLVVRSSSHASGCSLRAG